MSAVLKKLRSECVVPHKRRKATPPSGQEILDTLCILYGFFYFSDNKSNEQFDAMENACNMMAECRHHGMMLNLVKLRNPTPPKPDGLD